MFTRVHRLSRGVDIQATIRRGRKVLVSPVVAYIAKTNPSDIARVAVVVGRKVSASAVRRHRIQRQLRNQAYLYIKDYPQGYDMVLVAQPSAGPRMTSQSVQDAMKSIYSQVQSIIT